MKKNITIGIIILAFIAIIGFVLWLNYSSRKMEQNEQPAISNQMPANLPAGRSSQQQTGERVPQKINDSAIRVEQIDNLKQIQDSYQKYINQNVDEFPAYLEDGISLDYSINDKNGRMVSLQTFLSAIGAYINPEVRELIGSNYYGLFYCINNNKQKEYGIAFDTGNGMSNNLQNESIKIKESMKRWEPYMLKDLHNILFPFDKLSESELNQKVFFKDGEFRHADINFTSGKKFIYYAVKTDEGSFVNRIYITTSQECLKKALDYLFDF